MSNHVLTTDKKKMEIEGSENDRKDSVYEK